MIRVFLLALVLAVAGCGTSAEQLVVHTAVTAANATRLTIESAETAAVALYKQQQLQAVQDVKASGGTREDAVARVTRIRDDWKPAWEALQTARKAHAVLVDVIAAYQAGRGVISDVTKAVTALTTAEDAVSGLLAKLRQ